MHTALSGIGNLYAYYAISMVTSLCLYRHILSIMTHPRDVKLPAVYVLAVESVSYDSRAPAFKAYGLLIDRAGASH